MLNEWTDEPQTTIHHQLINMEYNTNLLVCMLFYISLRPYPLYFRSRNSQISSSYRLLTIFRVVTSTEDLITCWYSFTAKSNQILKLLKDLSICPCTGGSHNVFIPPYRTCRNPFLLALHRYSTRRSLEGLCKKNK